MTLIPKAGKYLDANLNVMLIGLHGVGKTEHILELAQERNLKLKYYSCSTLDPYTDLVGVPIPTVDPVTGVEYLKMVRPRDIDEAEFLFFDEFNRADPKIHNAIFEIIQFKSINGEKLPNLKCVWAAMNPPGKTYNVEALDPALVDRFDLFIEIAPTPSVEYMSQNGLTKPIAQALFAWWKDHNLAKRGEENYISPRRLMKIGLIFQITGDIDRAIPKWITTDRKKLKTLLRATNSKTAPKVAAAKDAISGDPFPNGPVTKSGVSLIVGDNIRRGPAVEYLQSHPEDMDFQTQILKALGNRHGATLGFNHDVLDGIQPSMLEGFISGLSTTRFESLKIYAVNYKLKLGPNLQKAIENRR